MAKGRPSIRLQEYETLRLTGISVTMVTRNKERLFGKIQGEGVVLNEWGKIALLLWQEIPKHFIQVSLDVFSVMPNHLHGILFIKELKTVKETNSRADGLASH